MSNQSTIDGIKVALSVESTEGVYVAPTATDYLEVMEAGATFNLTREEKVRNVRSGDRFNTDSKLSYRNAEVQIPLELKAGLNEGDKPAHFKLWESFGFSDSKSLAARVSGTVLSSTLIDVAEADLADFHKYDIVLIKKSGKDQPNVVKSIIDADPIFRVELMIPLVDIANGQTVEFAKSVMAELDPSVDKTLSATRYHDGNQIVDKVTGCRTQAIEVSNFTSGEYPEFSATLPGMDWLRELLGSPDTVTTTYEKTRPPLIVNACILKNTTKVGASEFGLSLSQTVAFKTTTCAENGKVGSIPTGKYEISGSINAYMSKDELNFELNEEEFSLFVYAFNPGAATGDKKQMVAFFIPMAKVISLEDGDSDGLHTSSVSFKATPDDQSESIKIAFI